MKRRLVVGVLLAVAAAAAWSCGSEPASPPAEPTASTTPSTIVDDYVGVWGADPADPVPPDIQLEDNTANTIVADGICRLIEFHVERQADGRSASIVFAATCANARIRGRGIGQLSNGVLFWKAEGVVTLTSGRTCQFRFVEGNRAAPAGEGLVKVSYNGTVCDVPVSGSQLVKRK
jgi:hypothetical protein